MGKPPVVTGVDYQRTPVKIEGGGGRKRSLSTTGPPLDDQGTVYSLALSCNHIQAVLPVSEGPGEI